MLPAYDDDCYHEHYLSLGLDFVHNLMKDSHEYQMHILQENSWYLIFVPL